MINLDHSSQPNNELKTEVRADETLNETVSIPLIERQKEALNECDRLIKHFDKEANEHKSNFKRLKKLSILLTLVVTFLSALTASGKLEHWEWIVPVVSSISALSTTLLTQTNSHKTWINSRNVGQKLRVEKFIYLQDSGQYTQLNEEDKVRFFSQRIMEIWSAGHETWGQNILEQKK